MDDYLNKENYVMKFNDEWYRKHLNSVIMNQYCNLLGKKCAVLGSNSGYQCYLVGEFNDVDEVIGFDINKDALEHGDTIIRSSFSSNISNKIKFKYSNLVKIDSDDAYFDSIISFHTLEHIYPKDMNMVISENYRILKNSGYVIVSIPYENAFHSPTQHVSSFNENTLRILFENNKFETIECYKDERIGSNVESLCLTGIFKKI